MSSTVFMVDDKNSLSPLSASGYESEDVFQKLLAEHPRLLEDVAGEERRLLLVRRELSVPDELTGAARWSLDHLFLDRQGVPVLVEVKRATDTRARREVVAQMLDYAANGVAYWPIEQIVAAHASSARQSAERPEETLEVFLDGGDPESFWRQVESNLRAGRIRMVFVADRIPKELRRIVEFLNEQMRPAEVLALQVDHYIGGNGTRLLMPELIGQTERALTGKSVTHAGPPLSVEDWLVDLRESKGEATEVVARKVIAWAVDHGLMVSVSASNDSIALSVAQANGRQAWPFFIRRSSGKVEVSLQYLSNTQAFRDEQARIALLDQLRHVPGAAIKTEKSTGWPSVSLIDLQKEATWLAWTSIADNVRKRLAEATA